VDKKALEQTINTVCEKSLADFKRPKDIIFLDELPKTALEKINKGALKECLIGEE
jgi:crotonobetaine/carnitine-CoA ligase